MKYDGYRIGCRIRGRSVTLTSRNAKDWTAAFPEIAKAALEGENLQRQPLEQRKRELLKMVGRPGPRARIRYSEHVIGGGARVFEEACRLKLGGLISKKRDAPYKPGRNDAWVKTKCVLRQEFVIGGFTDPEGSRQGIGALLVGYFEGDALVFAGKVGTGFTVQSARRLRTQLEALEQETCPFSPRPPGWLGSHAHWVKPKLVAEVVFAEWTDDERIRHPSFQGTPRGQGPPRGRAGARSARRRGRATA